MTKRILHIMPGYGGGIGSYIINIIRSSKPELIINDVASFTTYPDFYKNDVESKGGKTFTLSRIKIKSILSSILELKDILKKQKYDIVYIHDTDWGALYFSTIARFYGIRRIIIHAHQTNHSDNKGVLQKIKFSLYKYLTVACATQLASCSKMASEFRFGAYYVKKHKVMHIPNSINVTAYEKEISKNEADILKESIGVRTNELLLGNVGYFRIQKNHPFLISIASALEMRKIPFKLCLIGVGEEQSKIIKLVDKLELKNHVIFLGQRNDVANLFKIMDVSILPSFFEGLPTVAVECQAAGTPILMADTITKEVDMGLGLTQYLSLNTNIDVWCDTILEMSRIPHVPASERISCIQQRYFTSSSAAELFYKFINKEISSYEFGERL
jgi:glycosyltransferase EpsF